MSMHITQNLAELHDNGFCILRKHFPLDPINTVREAFWPALEDYVERHRHASNRGSHRYCIPMPFSPLCFSPTLFFNPGVLSILHSAMEDRIVADQWHCDVPLLGSENQEAHIDYRRPLFPESPSLLLPPYMLLVSFGLVRITLADGPIEIAPGTHHRASAQSPIAMQPIPLELGDVLIRHPWAVHRGTPNTTGTPRALLTIRYVRRWYADDSREVNAIPRFLWESLTPEQQALMRFPVEN